MKNQHLFQKLLVFSLAAGLVFSGTSAWAEDADTAQLKQQIQQLQNQVNQLQSQLAGHQQMPKVSYYDQWQDPFAQMAQMELQMERNMRQAFDNNEVMFNPKMDMKQTEHHYIITMDLPGMDKNKINVEAKDGVLTVSGERRSEVTKDNKGNHSYRQERSFGSFMQAVPLPEDARADQIDASYRNGVLTVSIGREKKRVASSQGQKITVK